MESSPMVRMLDGVFMLWSTSYQHFDINAHGVGLAILTPVWMEYVLDEERLDKFVEYGVNVWDIDRNMDKYEIARLAIDKTRDFFKSIGIPMSLREVGIKEEDLEKMARAAIDNNRGKEIGNFKPLDYEDVLNIQKPIRML